MAEPKSRGGTETILVVEDDAAVRRPRANAVLKHHGYHMLEAADGLQR